MPGLLLLLGAASLPAQAQTNAAGKIVFSSSRQDLNSELYLMNLDGTNVQRLTYNLAEDREAALSPDGTMVAFSSNRGITRPQGYAVNYSSGMAVNIYVMNVDGTGLRQLSFFGKVGGHPTWSPDGTQIAFESTGPDDKEYVYKVPVAGGTPVQLAPGSNTGNLTWQMTPQGERIGYGSPSNSQGYSYPFSMKPDGTDQKSEQGGLRTYSRDGSMYLYYSSLQSVEVRKTADDSTLGGISLYGFAPRISFSADGRKIVFSGYYSNTEGPYKTHIYSANVNGTALTDLTRAEGFDEMPSCGPGMVQAVPAPPTGFGRLLLTASDGIYAMNPTGWGLQAIVPDTSVVKPKAVLREAVWSPDGTQIAADDGQNLFLMSSDGSNLRNVTGLTTGYAIQPSWSSDGQTLTYTYQDGSPYYYHERIHTIKVDGTGDVVWSAETKSYGSPARQPSSQPDEGAVAYFQGGAYLESSVAIAFSPNGGSIVPFTNRLADSSYDSGETGGQSYQSPAWNPTGTRLAVISTERRRDTTKSYAFLTNSNILTCAADGTDIRNLTGHSLTSDTSVYESLAYSPDATSIAYFYGQELTTLSLDGTAESRFFYTRFHHVDWGKNFSYFTPEKQAPVVAITTPGASTSRKLLKLGGTIDDSGASASGPAVVCLQLQRLSDNKYWNPALTGTDRWSTTAAVFPGNFGAADAAKPQQFTWEARDSDLPTLAAMPSGSYRVTAYGLDNAGNQSATVGANFTVFSPGTLGFSAQSYTFDEQTGQGTPGAVVVTRTGGSDGTVTVDYAALNTGTSQGLATANVDFNLPSGTLTFGPGETSKTLPLTVLDDNLIEGNESFTIQLSNPTGSADFGTDASYSTYPLSAYLTLSDDEAVKAGHFNLSPGVVLVRSDAGTATLNIERTGGSIPADLKVSLLYPDNGDPRYTDVSQTLHFEANETAKSLSVPILDNTNNAPDQHVFVYLSTPAEVRFGQLVIRDKNYTVPGGFFSFTQHSYTVLDSSDGVDLTVQRTGGSSGDTGYYPYVQPDYSYHPGTASSGDYSIANNSAPFADGDSANKTIHVNLTAGMASGGAKTINLYLQAAEGISDYATITVLPDTTGPGSFQFAQAADSGTEGADVTLIVNRVGGSQGAANVPFTVSGSATRNADYTVATPSPLHFAAGETSRSIALHLATDSAAEAAETVIVTLGTPAAGALGATTAETVTILDGPSGLSTLTVSTTGSGTVTRGFLGASARTIGTRYTVTATPATGYLFAGWTGGVTASAARLTFSMAAQLSLTANFVPNPFLTTTGSYYGLAHAEQETVDPSLVQLALGSSGAFTGSVAFPVALRSFLPPGSAAKLPFSGTFSALGHYTREGKAGLISYRIDLQHSPLEEGLVTGTVKLGNVTFTVAARRALYSAKNPAPVAGQYTLALVPAPGESGSPRGHGFATVTVSPTGATTVRGTLADGTALAATGMLTKGAEAILFQPLYAGGYGQFTAPLHFTPDGVPADTDIRTQAFWARPGVAPDGRPHPYAAGFQTKLSALASVFTKPAVGRNIFAQATSSAAFTTTSNVANTAPVVHTVTVNDRSVLSYTGADRVSGTFDERSGLFTGSYTVAGSTAAPVKGIVLQKQNIALGYYLESSVSADFSLKP